MKDFLPHIYKIQRYAIHDGPGIRTTLFFQGCPLACTWCHNPESQAMEPVSGMGEGSRTEKDFQDQEGVSMPSIKQRVPALVREIERDRIFFDQSGGGVTFSGGEPLGRPELLITLLDLCREKEIHTCLDTCGFAPFGVLKAVADRANLVHYDIKIMDDQDHQRLTGKPVGPILDNLKKLSELGVNVRLRFPLIPTCTDSDQNVNQIIGFLNQETKFRKIHILPYHQAGAGKYERLKMKNPLTQINPPSQARVNAVQKAFASGGFKTTIGG